MSFSNKIATFPLPATEKSKEMTPKLKAFVKKRPRYYFETFDSKTQKLEDFTFVCKRVYDFASESFIFYENSRGTGQTLP